MSNIRIRIQHDKIESMTLFKLRDFIFCLFFNQKRPSFVKIQNKSAIKRLNCLFLKTDGKLNLKNVQFVPLQDNFSIDEIENLIFKSENKEIENDRNGEMSENDRNEEVNENDSNEENRAMSENVIKNKDRNENVKNSEINQNVIKNSEINQSGINQSDRNDYFKYFIIQDPESVYLEDAIHVKSIVSVGRKEDLNIKEYKRVTNINSNINSKLNNFTFERIIAIDCEMIKTKFGVELGRVTLVDFFENVLCDHFVKPKGKIIEYKTEFSGLTPESFKNAISFKEAQKSVLDKIKPYSIILGHSLFNDLHILKIYHPFLIDTSRLFRTRDNYKIRLKILIKKYFNEIIQDSKHDSREDAIACIKLLNL
ncbi:3'-5' exonuclease, partial [Pseudoloma neurophilia]